MCSASLFHQFSLLASNPSVNLHFALNYIVLFVMCFKNGMFWNTIILAIFILCIFEFFILCEGILCLIMCSHFNFFVLKHFAYFVIYHIIISLYYTTCMQFSNLQFKIVCIAQTRNKHLLCIEILCCFCSNITCLYIYMYILSALLCRLKLLSFEF